MRQIGTVSDGKQARRFEDYLLARGITSSLDETDNGWEIWVHDEDQIEEARGELQDFVENPDQERYHQAAETATALRRDREKQSKAAQKRYVDVRSRWEQPMWRRTPVSFGLIAISVFVAVIGSNGFFRLCDNYSVTGPLFITSPDAEGRWMLGSDLTEVKSGQVWRLITPIFLHGDLLHLLFNMYWVRTLSVPVEFRLGSGRLLWYVLLIAATSNLAQYYMSGPNFLGMSGVVFGLFGFIWAKGRFDPGAGLAMPPNLTFFVVIYFMFCLTGALGPIANWAHGVGALSGIALGARPGSGR